MKKFKLLLLIFCLGGCSTNVQKEITEMSPSQAYSKGMSYLEKKNFKTAILYFQKSKTESEYRTNSILAESDAFSAMGEHLQVKNILEELIVDDLFDVEGRFRLVKSYEFYGESDKALKILNQILMLQPRNIKARYVKAQIYYKMNLLINGLATVNELIILNPSDIEALCLRGKILEKSGKVQLASKDYRAALAYDSTNAESMHGLIRLYSITREFEKALKLVNQWQMIDPDSTSIPIIKTEILLKLGRKDEVLVIYRDLVNKFPNTIEYRLKLVEYMISDRNLTQAKEHLDLVLKKSPWDIKANYFLGKILIEEQDFSKAGILFKKLYDHYPKQEWVAASYSKILNHLNESKASQKVAADFYEKSSLNVVEEAKTNTNRVKREISSLRVLENIKIRVEKGASLQSLSKYYYGTTIYWKNIFNANREMIKSSNHITVGQEIVIPRLNNE